jgi:hypothetical protein
MATYRPVSIVWDGRAYAASFHEWAGEVVVSSAYGSRRAKIGKLAAKAVAERLLLELAKASGK